MTREEIIRDIHALEVEIAEFYEAKLERERQ